MYIKRFWNTPEFLEKKTVMYLNLTIFLVANIGCIVSVPIQGPVWNDEVVGKKLATPCGVAELESWKLTEDASLYFQ